jgi:hypothetical protein
MLTVVKKEMNVEVVLEGAMFAIKSKLNPGVRSLGEGYLIDLDETFLLIDDVICVMEDEHVRSKLNVISSRYRSLVISEGISIGYLYSCLTVISYCLSVIRGI